MRVMVLVKANKDSETGMLPPRELFEEMDKFNRELAKAGVMMAADGLHPSSKGVRVKFSGATRTVIPGPFSLTDDLLAGYWLWNVKSLDDAVEWLKKAPFGGGVEIEIRPIMEEAEFIAKLEQHRAA